MRTPARRTAAVLAAVLGFVGLITAGALGHPLAAAADTTNSSTPDGTVAVSVLDVTPNTPSNTATPQPVVFTLRLQNTSSAPLPHLTVVPSRGEPITTQQALQSAIADPQPAPENDQGYVTSPTAGAITASLGAGQSKTITIPTTSSTQNNGSLCICVLSPAIYPIYFSVKSIQPDGSAVEVGKAQTYLPAFPSARQAVQVSWVWPLLERPHRLTSDTVFSDDGLAASVASGGRLQRLLEIAEQAALAKIPLTLLIDPELLDELQVMSTGYQVAQPGSAAPATGTGGPQAAAWLGQLRSLLAVPGMELALTPYANPDVESLSQNGLSWATNMPSAMQSRVVTALGRNVPNQEVAWPSNGSISEPTAAQLARTGVHTVLVNATDLRTNSSSVGGASLISTPNGYLTAYATPSAVATFLPGALGVGGTGVLPTLVSEVAMAAVLDPSATNQVVLVPPANLDPDPTAALRAIEATSTTLWSQPAPLLAAEQRIPATARATLAASVPATLPDQTVQTIRRALDASPALTSMLADSPDSSAVFSSLPEALQRLESSSWDEDYAGQAAATNQIASSIDALTQGVKLVVPTSGSYTLGSRSSPLPITVANTTPYTVLVQLQLSAVFGVPGFSAKDIGLQKIPPNSRLPLHVPVHVDRAGRIKVQVTLTTPAGTAGGQPQLLGTPLVLSVRSTALGDIGEIIMWAAGIVLGLALLFRAVRRIRARRGSGSGPAPANGAPTSGPELQPADGTR